MAHLPQTLAELGAHEQVDEHLGEAVAEAEPHAVEVDGLGDVLAGPTLGALGHSDEGEGEPGEEEHDCDDEADVVVPGALREVLVHPLEKREKEVELFVYLMCSSRCAGGRGGGGGGI